MGTWRKDPAGCCTPTAPAEPGTSQRCSRSHNVSSWKPNILSSRFVSWVLCLAIKDLFSVDWYLLKSPHTSPQARSEERAEKGLEQLEAFQGDPGWRMDPPAGNCPGAIPVPLSKSCALFCAALKSRKISTLLFLESLNILVYRGLMWTPAMEPQ